MALILRLAAALAVTAGSLYLALHGVDWGEIGTDLSGTSYSWVAVMVVMSVVAVYIRALRWRVILLPSGRVGIGPLFSATAIGFMGNMLLPLRAGEVIRPLLVGQQTTLATSAVVASVVLERLFDMFLLFCFLLGIGLVVPVPPSMRSASYIVAAVGPLIMVGLAVLMRYREAAILRLQRSLSRLPGSVGERITEIVESFVIGLSGVADLRTVAILFGYSFVLWAVIASTFTCGLLALDVPVPLTAASISLVVIVAAFVALPQAPGYFGTWQLGCTTALAFYGVVQEDALALSLVTHVIQILVVVGLGGVCLATTRVRVRELMRLAGRTQGETP